MDSGRLAERVIGPLRAGPVGSAPEWHAQNWPVFSRCATGWWRRSASKRRPKCGRARPTIKGS